MKLITMKNCPRCQELKAKLERDGVKVHEVLFADLPLVEKRRLARGARDGELEFPIVEED